MGDTAGSSDVSGAGSCSAAGGDTADCWPRPGPELGLETGTGVERRRVDSGLGGGVGGLS